MRLAEVQALFWRAIAWPTGVEDFLAQADDATRRAFDHAFAGTPDFDRVARMNVYAQAYFWRLYEVAVDQLGVTAWLAGGAPFHDFVTDYVLAQPSHDPDVRRFASGIPDALREHALERSIPGLADVAAVEWAIVSAVDGPDDDVLTTDDLAALPQDRWPTLQLHAVRTATLVPCRLDFAALHSAKESGAAPSLELQEHTILVWRRPDLDVHYRTLEPTETRAVTALVQGRSFADLCHVAGDPERVVAWLHRWLRDGLLTAETPRTPRASPRSRA